MHRFIVIPLFALLLSAALLSGCKGSRRNEALSGEQVIRAANEQGIEVAITHIRQNRKHVVLSVELANKGETTVELRNPGDSMRGFMVEANGRSVPALARLGGHWGPWVGYRPGSESQAAGVMELAPGTTAGLELHFRWPRPYQDRHDYSWELRVSQIFPQDSNEALPVITLQP